MSATIAATPRVRVIQRTALAMLVLAGAVNYIDRATLAVANPLIREELGLSLADMGYLLSAFLWAYAFAQLPTGAMVDKLGPRLLLTMGLSLWSLAQLLGGLVQNFGQFFAARLLLGVGEAPQFPTGARVARDWFNPRDRGLATGIFNCASTLGTAIAVPLLTFLMLSFGWRWMFVIMGVAGLLVAALWFALYRNPQQVALTAEENAYRTQGDPPGQRTQVTFGEWKAAVPVPHHLGDDRRLFRLHLSHLDLHRVAAGLPRDRAAHEREVHGHRGRHPVRLGRGRRRLGRLSGGHPGAPRGVADAQPQIPGGDRPAGHRGLHRGRGVCREQHAGDRVHLRIAVPGLRDQHLRLGAQLGCGADQLHRLDRRDAEFRRLSRRRAGADGHGADRAVDRVVRMGAGGGRRDRDGRRPAATCSW